tara:strand:+ start:1058 stop:1351 length:294 start_codon:yes stop_codon:yes gene_type:complete
MGFWRDKQDVVIGDEPANVMETAIKDINAAYFKTLGRPVTCEEVIQIARFCFGHRCNGVTRMRKEDHATKTRRDHEEPVMADDAGDHEPGDIDTPAK